MVGTREGTETIEKGGLIVGEIVMEWGPTSLVPIDARIVRIHGSPVNVKTFHIHRSMQIEVQTPQKSDGPVMLPWML